MARGPASMPSTSTLSANASRRSKSAGAHFNPGNHKHGMIAGAGHAGDMPNLHVPQSGDLAIELVNANVTLDKGKPNSLLDQRVRLALSASRWR